jgi:hypothetical protein
VKSKKFQEVNLTKRTMSKLPPDAELLAIEQASIRLGAKTVRDDRISEPEVFHKKIASNRNISPVG